MFRHPSRGFGPLPARQAAKLRSEVCWSSRAVVSHSSAIGIAHRDVWRARSRFHFARRTVSYRALMSPAFIACIWRESGGDEGNPFKDLAQIAGLRRMVECAIYFLIKLRHFFRFVLNCPGLTRSPLSGQVYFDEANGRHLNVQIVCLKELLVDRTGVIYVCF